MNRRSPQRALTHIEVRTLSEAVHRSRKAGLPLNAHLVINPALLPIAPQDPGEYFRKRVIDVLGTFCRRRDAAWLAVWVRENYTGGAYYREHLHLMLHVPKRLWAELQAAIARWWPETGVAHLTRVYDAQGLAGYLAKQMSSRAAYATGFRIRRERVCRRTGAQVAPVLGRRFGMSRALRKLLLPIPAQQSGAADV